MPWRALRCLPILAVLTACASDLDVEPGAVQWMEWPAEVTAATPFAARLILPFPACHPWSFKEGVSADQSAVTFEPYFLVKQGDPVCLPAPADLSPLPFVMLDTLGTAPGLAATFARTFEMRASATVSAPSPAPGNGSSPVRTFGIVTVRLSAPDTSRRNAAGVVTILVDNSGCVRIQPAGYYGAPQGFVLEDQADTAGLMNAFVRGYFHDAAAPVCGQTRVFHVESRN